MGVINTLFSIPHVKFILFLFSGKVPTPRSSIGGGDTDTAPLLRRHDHIIIHVKPRHGGKTNGLV